MRNLVFNVNGQLITRENPNELIVAGTSGYWEAKFMFSKDWDNTQKVVAFYTKYGKELPPCVLSAENTCKIPKEALSLHEFKLSVLGKRKDCVITTKPITITQYGGK